MHEYKTKSTGPVIRVVSLGLQAPRPQYRGDAAAPYAKVTEVELRAMVPRLATKFG